MGHNQTIIFRRLPVEFRTYKQAALQQLKIDLGVLTLNVHGALYGLSINGEEVHCFDNRTESKVSTISTKGQTAKLVVVDKKGYKRPPGEISKNVHPWQQKTEAH